MEIVINNDFGGFYIPNEFFRLNNLENHYHNYSWDRTDALLIEYVKNHPIEEHYLHGLVIVTIPDAATDWRISDYDGKETVWYVFDGKMYQANTSAQICGNCYLYDRDCMMCINTSHHKEPNYLCEHDEQFGAEWTPLKDPNRYCSDDLKEAYEKFLKEK